MKFNLNFFTDNTHNIWHIYIYYNDTDKYAYAVQDRLRGDIQASTEAANEEILQIKRAKSENQFSYSSMGNACSVFFSNAGVTIENQFTGDKINDMPHEDMILILNKWIEFISNDAPLNFTWDSNVAWDVITTK